MEAAIVTTIANSYNSSSSTCAHLILVVAHPVRGDLVNSRRFLRCRSRACSGWGAPSGSPQTRRWWRGNLWVEWWYRAPATPACMSTRQALHRRKLKLCKFKEKTVKSLTCRWSEYLGGCACACFWWLQSCPRTREQELRAGRTWHVVHAVKVESIK